MHEVVNLSDPLSSALSTIQNYETRRKKLCVIWPASKLLGEVLRVMKENGFINDYRFIDNGRQGKFVVELSGRITKCRAIRPRFSTTVDEIEEWEKRFLPAKDLGILVLTTPQGIMTHNEAKNRHIGGKLLAYVY